MLDFTHVTVLSFDCYGTLIDWESGILTALRPILSQYGIDKPDTELLELYGRFERQAQEQTPFVKYNTVLRDVAASFCRHFNINPKVGAEMEPILADSLGDWPAFPDTVKALERLKSRFKLAIISNVDDEMFRLSQAHLGVTFDWVITSEQIGSYKPNQGNFRHALRVMDVNPAQHVHVAQSLHHDIAPARALGWKTVWVNRRGAVSTPMVDSQPDLQVPNLESLARLVIAGGLPSTFPLVATSDSIEENILGGYSS